MNEMYVLIVLDNGALVISTFRHYISLDNGHYDFRHLDTKVVDIWFPNLSFWLGLVLETYNLIQYILMYKKYLYLWNMMFFIPSGFSKYFEKYVDLTMISTVEKVSKIVFF